MYIERFQTQNRSFSRRSTPQSNPSSNQIRPKVSRLNHSLNKINTKPDKQELLLQELQNSLIGQYESNNNNDYNIQQYGNQSSLNKNTDFRYLYASQNMREKSPHNQRLNQPSSVTASILKEKQKLQQIYKGIPKSSGGSKKVEQKFTNKKQEIKSIINSQETINSNLFHKKLESLKINEQDLNFKMNINNNNSDKNYCFYDGSYYQNYMRNPPPEMSEYDSSRNTSFYTSNVGGGVGDVDQTDQLQENQNKLENINIIRTITSSNNIQKEENVMNKRIQNYKGKISDNNGQQNNENNLKQNSMTNNSNTNSNKEQINYIDRNKKPPNSFYNKSQNSSQQFDNKNNINNNNHLNGQHIMIQQQQNIETKEDKNNQNYNSSVQISQIQNQQNLDPLSQIDELKQIMMIEQENISKILNKGNIALQAKSQNMNNSSYKESKQSFYKNKDISISEINKNGLLGAYEEYNKMTKHEIIEKLLVSEHIMKQLYKKTKQLQSQIQENQSKQEVNES